MSYSFCKIFAIGSEHEVAGEVRIGDVPPKHCLHNKTRSLFKQMCTYGLAVMHVNNRMSPRTLSYNNEHVSNTWTREHAQREYAIHRLYTRKLCRELRVESTGE